VYTFLTAWKSAADHLPHPVDRVVDHLGLIDGVRQASSARLTELREDHPWIDVALESLRRQFVPIARDELFALWEEHDVVNQIVEGGARKASQSPLDLFIDPSVDALLKGDDPYRRYGRTGQRKDKRTRYFSGRSTNPSQGRRRRTGTHLIHNGCSSLHGRAPEWPRSTR
jgi:hypothetical protein